MKSKLKNAEIVGLGESVYGSHEIFSLRNKLIFYLIDSLNFEIVTFANDGIPAKQIDRLIIAEDFNPLKSQDSSYYNIRGSNEMTTLSRGLESRSRDKKFIQTEEYNLQNYYYLRNVLLAAFSEYDSSLLLQLKKIEQYRYSEPYSDGKYHTLNSMVQEMADSFSAKESLHSKMGVAKTEEIRGCLSSFSSIYKLQQTGTAKLNDKNYERRQFYRDSLMANNIIRLRSKYPGKKIIVIGNSGHVGKETCSLEYTPSSMGGILKKTLGKKYINFDLFIGEGATSGYNKYGEPAIYHFPKAGLFNYGYYFSKIPTSCYYLDVQQIHENRILTDLQTSLIGFDYTPKPQFYSTDLNKSFDGVFFIHTSTPSKSLYMNP